MPVHRMKVDYANLRQLVAINWLPWQRPSSDHKKKIRMFMPTHMCTYPEDQYPVIQYILR